MNSLTHMDVVCVDALIAGAAKHQIIHHLREKDRNIVKNYKKSHSYIQILYPIIIHFFKFVCFFNLAMFLWKKDQH